MNAKNHKSSPGQEEVGKCQLCLLEKKLIKAHIIPEFLYKLLYEDGSYWEVHPKENTLPEARRRRQGIYDDGILCSDCDNGIINRKYDDYAAKLFWGHKSIEPPQDFRSSSDPRVKWRLSKNVDSSRIRLFFLSLLWRAHISDFSIFEQVDLGEKHGEIIRRMILDGDSGDPFTYPIVLMHYSIGNPNSQRLISGILKKKKFGKTQYSMALGGILVIWYISESMVDERLNDFVLGSKESEILIPHSITQGANFLATYLGDRFIKYALENAP